MKLELNCPYAKYNERMHIVCRKTKDICGHQYYKQCKGWSVLTDTAAKCPQRKGKK